MSRPMLKAPASLFTAGAEIIPPFPMRSQDEKTDHAGNHGTQRIASLPPNGWQARSQVPPISSGLSVRKSLQKDLVTEFVAFHF